MTVRLARAGAIACSLGLFAFVVLHAQFGCDAPASTAPAAGDARSKAEPALAPAPAPNPAPAQAVAPPAEPEPTPAPEPEPVFMPASKSGGDFGAMRFPGEQQAAQAQQQNPAPNGR